MRILTWPKRRAFNLGGSNGNFWVEVQPEQPFVLDDKEADWEIKYMGAKLYNGLIILKHNVVGFEIPRRRLCDSYRPT